jgi:hypothetical protein
MGLATFVVGVVVTFPARVAYRWFVPSDVQLAGIGGSVWSGTARELETGGIYLRDLEWRLRPLSILTGGLGLRVEASPASGFVETDLTLRPGGNIVFSDLRASLPLQMFAQILNMPGLSGNASLEFDLLRLDDGLPVDAAGTVSVAGVTAPLIDSAPIGAYRMEFVSNESGVVASIEDTAGVFDIAGSLTVRADRRYEFLGLVAANEQTSEKLRGQLRFLGTPNDRGQHEVRLEGVL